MCFGGKSKSSPMPVPPPAPPTQFGYVDADTSNTAQRKAAVMSSTEQEGVSGGQSFGAELGSTGAAAPTQTGGM